MGSHSGGEGSPPFENFMNDDEDICGIEVNKILTNSNNTNSSQIKTTKVTEKKTNENMLNLLYKMNDVGPFWVNIEKIENEDENMFKKNYNYMKIAKEIYQMNLNNISKVKQKGRNKIGIEFSHYQSANDFLNNKYLIDKGYKIYIPFNMVTCKGIIRRVDPELSTDEINEMIKSPFKVLEIKRLNRKKITETKQAEFIPTGTLLLTFSGTIMPRNVTISYLSFQVSPYVTPVTQCYKCLLYGHTKNQCRGKKKCFSCTENHTTEDQYENCKIIKCLHCDSINHKSNNKICTEHVRQKNIKEKMAFENISYFEAANLFPKLKKNNSNTNNVNEGNIIRFRGNEFPTIAQNNNASNVGISINQRQSTYINQNKQNKRSYTEIISNNNNGKKRLIHTNRNNNYKDLMFYNNGRLPNSCPNLKINSQNKNIDTNNDSNLPHTSNMPDSADTDLNMEMREFYNYFLKLQNKHTALDLINTYFKLDNSEDFDNFY